MPTKNDCFTQLINSMQQEDQDGPVAKVLLQSSICGQLIHQALEDGEALTPASNESSIAKAETLIDELVKLDGLTMNKTQSEIVKVSPITPDSKLMQKNSQQEKAQEVFQDAYMEEFTATFGDELNHFRQDNTFEEHHLSFLIDCIHTTGTILTAEEKQLLSNSSE